MGKIFVIDVSKCSGCHNCQLSCKDEHCENDWTPYAAPQPATGQFWCKVYDYVRGTVPKVKVHYITKMCNHCENAPCLEQGHGAVYRRPDGLILIDPEKSKGMKDIVASCPYGAIFWNEELQIPQKCTGCAHMLDNGEKLPRCVEACPTDAMKFGDEEDFKDIISKAEVLHPEFGTKPKVYYINIPKYFVGGLVYDLDIEEVVIGAKVVMTFSNGTTLETTTDDFGDFWFKELEEDIVEVDIFADGYKQKHFIDIHTVDCTNLGEIPL